MGAGAAASAADPPDRPAPIQRRATSHIACGTRAHHPARPPHRSKPRCVCVYVCVCVCVCVCLFT